MMSQTFGINSKREIERGKDGYKGKKIEKEWRALWEEGEEEEEEVEEKKYFIIEIKACKTHQKWKKGYFTGILK